jgi:hypothetical protein
VIAVATEILDFDPGIAMLESLPPERAELTGSQEMVIFLMRYAAGIVSRNPPSEHRTRLLQRIYLCLMRAAVDSVEGNQPRLQ